MINKIKSIIKRRRLLKSSPEMIYAYVHNGNKINGLRIGSSTSIISPDDLTISENVFIGQYNFIEASNGIEIHEGCQITNFISILTHSSHISIRLLGKNYNKYKDPPGYIKGAVSIGAYTFVGPHSTIMPGTVIGKGCIISAYSLVKGTFPDFSIISGNPAVVSGSTKDLDKKYLENDTSLQKNYDEWAKD